jgi:putative transposase
MGAALMITRLEYTAAALRLAAAKSRDGAQVRRLLALAMVLEGCPRAQAARQNGMDRQTLRDWVHRYNQAGIDGLKSLRSPGAPPALTAEQMAELHDLVVKGPDPAIHQVARWRCVDLREEVARRYDVTVHESTIGKWLHRLGLSRVQPRPYHPQKAPEAEATFKKTLLPC